MLGNESQNIDCTKYSTSEQEIGRWIDGKKLYRMTVTATDLNVNTANSITIPNGNTILVKNIYGNVYGGGGGFVTTVNCMFSADNVNGRTAAYTLQGNNTIRSYCGAYATGNNKYDTVIFLEYTKK